MVAPEPQERIARMAAEGVITPDQASRLRSSLACAGMRLAMPRSSDGAWRPGLTVLAFIAFAGWILAILLGDPSAGEIQSVRDVLNGPGSVGEMNDLLSGVFAIVLLVALPVFGWMWVHNSLVGKEEATHAAWAVEEYNSSIRKIPASLVARAGNFRRKGYYKAEPDAIDAPELSFQ